VRTLTLHKFVVRCLKPWPNRYSAWLVSYISHGRTPRQFYARTLSM